MLPQASILILALRLLLDVRCLLAYVHSVQDVQDNLYLRTDARVSRVLFDANNKAVGVAYVPSRNRASGGKVQETIVKARKMVVISSGTLGTPQILERSGVGNAELLRDLGIKVVSDLPGVGEEYQDHYTTLSRESWLESVLMGWDSSTIQCSASRTRLRRLTTSFVA